MNGDFSRDTFSRQHHFSRVLMQQGRVLLDADWNEQAAILLHYLRTLAADLIGPHGGPGDGFKISCEDAPKCDFFIARGRYYVDGILCENLPPETCPAGDDPEPLRYTAQKDYPIGEHDEARLGDGKYLVYLDVWERELTHLDVDHIRELALGGPDTAARAQVVWQVKVAEYAGDGRDCNDLLRDLVINPRRPSPCMRARARVTEPCLDPCIIPPKAQYRGRENQLYRVEIHDGGTAADAKAPATYKWSRDNASSAFAIRSLQGKVATLAGLGSNDERDRLREGDWVEVVDDFSVLRFARRPLVRVAAIDTVSREVRLDVPDRLELPTFDEGSDTHPVLVRWDQQSAAVPIEEGVWIDLEDGVQILFEQRKTGVYRTGDYWQVPARRNAGGAVLWPAEPGPDGNMVPRALPPMGIDHHYAPLARIALDNGAVTCEEPCRCGIEPLCGATGKSATAKMPERPRAGISRAPTDEPRSDPGIPVREILGIGDAYAKRLESKGIGSAEQVLGLTPDALAKILTESDGPEVSSTKAESLIEQARKCVADHGNR